MKNNLTQISILVLLILLSGISGPGTQEIPPFEPTFPEAPPFLRAGEAWVDSVMDQLSLEEKIAQMIMVQAYSNRDEEHVKSVIRLITRHRVGGIAFFQGDPVSQALMTNRFQERTKVPLMVAIDGETGLGMRLENTIKYPCQMVLGAISDNSLVYDLGKDMARQMQTAGRSYEFCPCG